MRIMEKKKPGRPKKTIIPEDVTIEKVKSYKPDGIEEYLLPIPTMEKKYNHGSGKPRKDIDLDLLFKLSKTILPVGTIANILGCSQDAIEDNYREILDRGRNERRHTLVQAMWYKGLYERDTKMLIWLSKQHLGYRDNQPETSPQVNYNVYVNEVPVGIRATALGITSAKD